jgi:hypothetical protein
LINCRLLLWSVHQHLLILLGFLSSLFKSSVELRLENLALRHQLGVLRRSAPKGLKLTPADRILWVWLRRVWSDWRSALIIVNQRRSSLGIVRDFVYFGVGKSDAGSLGVLPCRRRFVI